MEPTEEEDAARQEALERITQVVQSMFPNATVSIFGSYVTGKDPSSAFQQATTISSLVVNSSWARIRIAGAASWLL